MSTIIVVVSLYIIFNRSTEATQTLEVKMLTMGSPHGDGGGGRGSS